MPDTLEGGAGRLYSNVDILFGGLVDRGNDLLVGGIRGLEGLALDTSDELVVNEPREG